MSVRKISLLQSVAAILAVRSRSSSQQSRICRHQVRQNREAIAKLLANPSQLLLLMPSYDAA